MITITMSGLMLLFFTLILWKVSQMKKLFSQTYIENFYMIKNKCERIYFPEKVREINIGILYGY